MEAPSDREWKFVKRIPCASAEFNAFGTEDLQGLVVAAKTEFGCDSKGYPRDVVQGKIVLVRRGKCMFEQKARLAQYSGAIGVIITQNDSKQPLFHMAGMAPDSWLKNIVTGATIPGYLVSMSHGELVEAMAGDAEVRATVKVESAALGTQLLPRGQSMPNKIRIVVSDTWALDLITSRAAGAGSDELQWTVVFIDPDTFR
mmetsp:Transcript_18559/g.47059  ORF Transcript_18559/g.47059 Transcript_18559/m.47059 type:complete len:201 (+) Transcript_18559:2-604(+)